MIRHVTKKRINENEHKESRNQSFVNIIGKSENLFRKSYSGEKVLKYKIINNSSI